MMKYIIDKLLRMHTNTHTLIATGQGLGNRRYLDVAKLCEGGDL